MTSPLKLEDLLEKFSDKTIWEITLLEDDSIEIEFDVTKVKINAKTKIETHKEVFDIPSKDGNWILFNLFEIKITEIKDTSTEAVLCFENDSKIKIEKFPINTEKPYLSITVWLDPDDWEMTEFTF